MNGYHRYTVYTPKKRVDRSEYTADFSTMNQNALHVNKIWHHEGSIRYRTIFGKAWTGNSSWSNWWQETCIFAASGKHFHWKKVSEAAWDGANSKGKQQYTREHTKKMAPTPTVSNSIIESTPRLSPRFNPIIGTPPAPTKIPCDKTNNGRGKSKKREPTPKQVKNVHPNTSTSPRVNVGGAPRVELDSTIPHKLHYANSSAKTTTYPRVKQTTIPIPAATKKNLTP